MEQKLDLILKKLEVLDSLDTRQKELYQITTAIRENLDVVNAKLESLSMDVHHLQGDVTALKDGQQVVIQIQQEQQKILERLSVRSIAHEADIAELRRIK